MAEDQGKLKKEKATSNQMLAGGFGEAVPPDEVYLDRPGVTKADMKADIPIVPKASKSPGTSETLPKNKTNAEALESFGKTAGG